MQWKEVIGSHWKGAVGIHWNQAIGSHWKGAVGSRWNQAIGSHWKGAVGSRWNQAIGSHALERSSRQPLEPGDRQPLERSSRQPLEPGNRQPLERSSRQPLEPGDRQPLGTSERQQHESHESRLEERQLSSVWITDSSPEPLSPGVSGIMFVNHYFVYETHLGKRKIMLELRLYTCKIYMSATLYILVYLSPQSYKLNNSICTPLDTAIKLCISLLYYSSLMLMMLCCTMACS